MSGGAAAGTWHLRVHTARHTNLAPAVPVIGHAGLAAHRIGKAPTRTTLRHAMRLALSAIEVDVVATRDGELVLYHDLTVADRRAVSALTLGEMRDAVRGVLTVDEALQVVDERTPLVLDVKTSLAIEPLLDFVQRTPGRAVTVCSERLAVLRALHERSPSTPLWRTFPDVGARKREHVWRVTTSLLAHRGTRAMSVAADLCRTVPRAASGRRSALDHLSGLPWRHTLPDLLATAHADLGIAGVTVHHPLITPNLCRAAHDLGIVVIAWTVNDPAVARRVVGYGVDALTTDRVDEIREALTVAH